MLNITFGYVDRKKCSPILNDFLLYLKHIYEMEKKVGASVASFVISWQLDPSPLKTKIEMKGKERRRIYTMHIFFISQFRI